MRQFFVLCLYCVVACFAADLPPFIHICHKSDPNLEQCIIASVEELRPYLRTGVPEYKIPSIEPLIMHDLIKEETAGMKITTSNVSAFGCSDFFVREISSDLATNTFVIDIDIPKLRIEAHYNVDGKLLLLPVKGSGNLEANVTDCTSRTTVVGEYYMKNGQQYIKYVSIDLSIKVGGGHVRLENLFNGDKILLGVLNDVVNKNLDMFLKELLPAIERNLATVFLNIANAIVDDFTEEQLFPN